jgi:hypothetical protein
VTDNTCLAAIVMIRFFAGLRQKNCTKNTVGLPFHNETVCKGFPSVSFERWTNSAGLGVEPQIKHWVFFLECELHALGHRLIDLAMLSCLFAVARSPNKFTIIN